MSFPFLVGCLQGARHRAGGRGSVAMSLSLQAREEALPEGMGKPQEQWTLGKPGKPAGGAKRSLGSGEGQRGREAPCARWDCTEPLGRQDACALGVWTWTGGHTGFFNQRVWL